MQVVLSSTVETDQGDMHGCAMATITTRCFIQLGLGRLI